MLGTRQYESHADPGISASAELCDGSVGIRAFRPGDTLALYEAVRESENEVCTWMVWCRPGYSLEDCARFVSSCDTDWREGRRYSFVIFDPRDGAFLGSIGLNGICTAHRFANVGYWVRTGMTRRGVASAALRLVARFAFEQTDLRRLEIVMPAENRASLRVAEKAGAKLEGEMRDRLLLGDKAHSALLYSLTRRDWESARSAASACDAPGGDAVAGGVLAKGFRPGVVAVAIYGLASKADVARGCDFLFESAQVGAQLFFMNCAKFSLFEIIA